MKRRETMGPKSNPSLMLFLFFLLVGLASSSYISNHVLESSRLTGRNLLQAKASCPVNFEAQNYTIVTSQCKGPNYSQKLCCDAFKQFACPFADEMNDLKSDCATTIFSYVNMYGHYPPGLFANLCREGGGGLDCDAPEAKDGEGDQKSGALKNAQSALLALALGFLMSLFNVF